jgi:lipopolysaccharide/colanic/teichoic acid biosynthesis glycosyltransferase
MIFKRMFDLFFSGLGLLLLCPLFLVISLAIKFESHGPVFFRQARVGRDGEVFWIHKFRTMAIDAEQRGLQITVGADPRVTSAGFFLRKYKLDELAQLIDVFIGKMSIVGPRPEVPFYVGLYPEAIRIIVLSVRPGITDLASIEFKDENKILGNALDPTKAYIDEILPIKLNYYVDYVQKRTFLGDIGIVLLTFKALIR